MTQTELKVLVTNTMHKLGMPAHIKGFNYVREAILVAVNEPSIIDNITRGLYPKVAEVFDSTPSRVERAIRHAIEVTWSRGDIDTLQKYFGYTVSCSKGKPTNSEFIALVADNILLEVVQVPSY